MWWIHGEANCWKYMKRQTQEAQGVHCGSQEDVPSRCPFEKVLTARLQGTQSVSNCYLSCGLSQQQTAASLKVTCPYPVSSGGEDVKAWTFHLDREQHWPTIFALEFQLTLPRTSSGLHCSCSCQVDRKSKEMQRHTPKGAVLWLHARFPEIFPFVCRVPLEDWLPLSSVAPPWTLS